MKTTDLATIVLTAESIAYFFIAGLALRRRDLREGIVRALVLYAIASFLWTLSLAFWQLGQLDFLPTGLQSHLPFHGALLLSLLFLYLNRSFLRLEGISLGWWAFGMAWVAALVAIDGDYVSLPQTLQLGKGLAFRRQETISVLQVVGWGILMGQAILLTVRTFRQVQQPLHRNRIRYWPMVWAFTIAGGILFFAGRHSWGSGFHLLGALIASYVVLTHRLPDITQFLRRTVSYLLITLLTIILYAGGVLGTEYVFQAVPGYTPLLAGAATALLLAIVFQPLSRLIQQLVSRLISGAGYDPSRSLREYSQSISNILDLERLATVALGIISEALEVRHGALFLVHRKEGGEDEDGHGRFHLRGVRGMGEEGPSPGVLPGDSPVANYLGQEHRPLTQYDIDLLPSFRGTTAAEREWLASLDVDVYVPIYAKEEWIGLLALGPKVSGDRYFDADLMLLSTLADQTAVALENVRLVEDLKQLNADLKQAYTELDKANRLLQEMDRLKSAFIGVITHELRTPFANIDFSLQLFERYGVNHLPDEQAEQLQQLTQDVASARKMVDNLVTFATFLSKQGELRPSLFDFSQVIQDTLLPLQPMAESKGLTLHVTTPEDLPQIFGDQERLADAVHHLVQNAIKFTEAGKVSIHSWAAEDTVHLEVTDTGVGVPADKLDTLWEDFTQMADPLRRGVEGLGLGLALVKYVVTAHGGSVWAESEEGVGSTFGFRVPLYPADGV